MTVPPAYAALLQAIDDRAEAERDVSRRLALESAMHAEDQQIGHLVRQLEREQGDVDALEGWSLRAVLAWLRRTRDEELTVERAEAEAVALEVAVRREAMAELVASTGGRTVADAEATLDAAGRRVERELARWEDEQMRSGSATGRELVEISRRAAELRATRDEVNEAVVAAATALKALGEARNSLSSAGSWSTYDTFFGGGVIASAVKHRRLDDAAAIVARVQRALLRLNAELADLRQPARPQVQLPSSTLQALDVWLDNPFSDWMVHRRIKASIASIERTSSSVATVARELREFRDSLVAEFAELVDERQRLLLAGPDDR